MEFKFKAIGVIHSPFKRNEDIDIGKFADPKGFDQIQGELEIFKELGFLHMNLILAGSLASLLAGLATGIGALLIFCIRKVSDRFLDSSLGFAAFANRRIELDGKSFLHCEFKDCLIILERGETALSGCTFKSCKLMFKGKACTMGRIIKLFAGEGPLRAFEV